MQEKFPGSEFQERKEVKKSSWNKARKLLIIGSLLMNGAFVGEAVNQHSELESFEKGEKQVFMVDRQEFPAAEYSKSGERGQYELEQSPDGHWTLTGKVTNYQIPKDNPDAVHERVQYAVMYEFTSLPPEAMKAITDRIKGANDADNPETGFMAALGHAIDSARKGTIMEYDLDGSVVHEVDLEDAGPEGMIVTQTMRDPRTGNEESRKISLGEFRTNHPDSSH
jgi:hypothetical protein